MEGKDKEKEEALVKEKLTKDKKKEETLVKGKKSKASKGNYLPLSHNWIRKTLEDEN